MTENKIDPVPGGYPQVIPFLIVKGAPGLIDFLEKVFGAEETDRVTMPDGRVAHSEVKIGESMIMISETSEEYPPNPTMIHIYIDDVDGVYKRAMEAGAESVMAPEDRFYGDRACMVKDATGNSWGIGTRIREIPPEEIEKLPESEAWKQRII